MNDGLDAVIKINKFKLFGIKKEYLLLCVKEIVLLELNKVGIH